MIILDTNVLSDLMRPEVNPSIIAWFDSQPRDLLWTTSVTVMEIRTGLILMPHGQRKDRLSDGFDDLLRCFFRGRALAFDAEAAEAASKIAALQQKRGRNIGIGDHQIAGIVFTRKARLATRNIRDFEELELELVDPWAG